MPVLRQSSEHLLRKIIPSYGLKRKHDAELSFWRDSLKHLGDWFQGGATGRTGIRPPAPDQRLCVSESWIVNAVMTRHAMCPSYTERLRIERDSLSGKRVLEIGSGPLAPIQQFTDCTRHCVDPLINMYMAAGWPLFGYEAKFINSGAESMPYPDGYFDAVISVNALDHVDNFEDAAAEIQRVVRRGGRLYFEVEYHSATVTEPIELDESRVVKAFSGCELEMITHRNGRELYEAMVKRFDLLPFQFDHFDGHFCTWHGLRK